VIIGSARIIFVRVKRRRRVNCDIREIEGQFSESIILLRSFLPLAFISCEFWVYSQYGKWRFFRIEDAGLLEIACDGNLLEGTKPGPPASTGTVSVEDMREPVRG
jgi:hypothetical protein